MTLREYLKKYRISHEDFAKNINYSKVHVTNYLNFRAKISKRMAQAICLATDGECTVAELLKNNPEENPIYMAKKLKRLQRIDPEEFRYD